MNLKNLFYCLLLAADISCCATRIHASGNITAAQVRGASQVPSIGNEYVLLLPNGTTVDEGGVLTKDNMVLTDPQTMPCDQHRLLTGRNIDHVMHIQGSVVVLSSPGSENYFHWMLQVLPRLAILLHSGVPYDTILVQNINESWQYESLNLACQHLQIPMNKVMILNSLGNSSFAVKADILIVPSIAFNPARGKMMPDWLPPLWKAAFGQPLVYPPLTGASRHQRAVRERREQERRTVHRLVYISRSKASIRRITNERDLTRRLETMGFKVVHLEDLTIPEQAKIFREADVVIAVHGSGLTNMVFMEQPGAKVYEISADPGVSAYGSMAEACGVRLMKVHPMIEVEDPQEDDMTLDVPVFAAMLRDLLSRDRVYIDPIYSIAWSDE